MEDSRSECVQSPVVETNPTSSARRFTPLFAIHLEESMTSVLRFLVLARSYLPDRVIGLTVKSERGKLSVTIKDYRIEKCKSTSGPCRAWKLALANDASRMSRNIGRDAARIRMIRI